MSTKRKQAGSAALSAAVKNAEEMKRALEQGLQRDQNRRRLVSAREIRALEALAVARAIREMMDAEAVRMRRDYGVAGYAIPNRRLLMAASGMLSILSRCESDLRTLDDAVEADLGAQG